MPPPGTLPPDPLPLPDWSDPAMALGSSLVAVVFLVRIAFMVRSGWIRWRYNLVHVERARSEGVERAKYLTPDRDDLGEAQQRGEAYAEARAAAHGQSVGTSSSKDQQPSSPPTHAGERASELISLLVAVSFVVLCGAVAVEVATGDASPGYGEASRVVFKRFWPGLCLAALLLLAAVARRGTQSPTA